MRGLPSLMQLRRRQLMQLCQTTTLGDAATVVPLLPFSWPLVKTTYTNNS
jgi:hypothetical protein